MNEIINLIERDFPDRVWLLRNHKPGRYSAKLHGLAPDGTHVDVLVCYASRPSEALSMVYNRALKERAYV